MRREPADNGGGEEVKLNELEATFVGGYTASGFRELGDSLEGAQGLLFICPKCQKHSVLCWFANPINAQKVPDDAFPRPGRWTFIGTGIADATLNPSVDLSKHEPGAIVGSFCDWHGSVSNGNAQ